MLSISEIKTGVHIEIDGQPYTVTWNQFGKTARQGGHMKTKLKNLLTGSTMERTFSGSEKAEPAEITYKRAQYLYATGDDYEFMDNETYEQMAFTAEQLGDTINYLSDGMEADVQYFNGNPINVSVQPKMTFEIIETDPGVKGNTAGNVTKDATISTGLVLKVPPFIEVGDKVVVNTLSGEYVERAK